MRIFVGILLVYGTVAVAAVTARRDGVKAYGARRTRTAHEAEMPGTAVEIQEIPPSVSDIWHRLAAAQQTAAAAAAVGAAAGAAVVAAPISHRYRSALCLSGGSLQQDERRAREERQRVRNVLLYYPNLIGYARVALVLTSYYLAEINWKASSCFYMVAFAGDAVDGHVARKFNQASRFGAVLDMVTDRCSTAGLLLVLSRLYDRHCAFAFLVLIFVDLFSHWMHTHSVIGKHHKSTSTLKQRNLLIRTYYDNLPFFAYCCIGAELFYVLLYVLHFVSEDSRAFVPLRKFCFCLCLPACVLKQLVNVAQVFSAARTLALEELVQK